jgi:hypothetical protein
VPADLGLIPDAAEREPNKFPPRRRAIDFARLVLPTPGGPTKQSTGPLSFFVSAWTARYSRMRSLIFFSP